VPDVLNGFILRWVWFLDVGVKNCNWLQRALLISNKGIVAVKMAKMPLPKRL
jgi:hypothetical protein